MVKTVELALARNFVEYPPKKFVDPQKRRENA
jgi:hypothetical protein